MPTVVAVASERIQVYISEQIKLTMNVLKINTKPVHMKEGKIFYSKKPFLVISEDEIVNCITWVHTV